MSQPVQRLKCEVQPYAWGSRSSIPKLLGKTHPQDSPWAELWMGAHPKAPSRLETGESLIDYIQRRPSELLGGSREQLPFLFKVLAADAPLSIQCHPNKAQAEAGFARENAAGIPLGAAHRNYRDDNHKPELIVALEPFWALKGFRAPGEVAALLRTAGIASLGAEAHALESSGDLRAFFSELLALTPERTKAALSELSLGRQALPESEARWAAELLTRYPSDQGCLSVLVLNLVELAAGEALYLGAGELHAYLRGTGLEIMANSDNVLRGGLTPKHMDSQELLRVLQFESAAPEVLRPAAHGGVCAYETPCPEFSLASLALSEAQQAVPSSEVAQIWLCLGGDIELTWLGGALHLSKGEVAFVDAATKVEARALSGAPTLWLAG